MHRFDKQKGSNSSQSKTALETMAVCLWSNTIRCSARRNNLIAAIEESRRRLHCGVDHHVAGESYVTVPSKRWIREHEDFHNSCIAIFSQGSFNLLGVSPITTQAVLARLDAASQWSSTVSASRHPNIGADNFLIQRIRALSCSLISFSAHLSAGDLNSEEKLGPECTYFTTILCGQYHDPII